ncbi:MAG: PQQ-dependent sugar dehydrogenase [Candidatus Binatia bacterium]
MSYSSHRGGGARICAAAAAAILVAAGAAAVPTVSDPLLQLETVTTGLSGPTTMAFVAPDDILVLQKSDGRVRRVLAGVLQADAVLDLAVNNDSERGLLGIAVNTADPPQVFLYYTAVSDPDGNGLPDSGAPTGHRVERYTWNAVSGRLENPQLVLDLPAAGGPNHDGGILVLGPTPTPGPGVPVGDGSLLHVVIGDLNHPGQLENSPGGAAADDTAVILRVEQDGSPAAGNPFVPYCSVSTTQSCPDGNGCPAGQTCITRVARYLGYGVRNSFGMALDPATGALWDTENGPGSYDEINLVAPGFNSGWTPIMGPDSRDPEGVGNLFAMPGGASVYSDPEFSWENPVAVTAIVFPLGSALGPAYDGVVLVGDFNHGNLYRLPLDPARTGFDLAAINGLADLVADSDSERNALRLGAGFGGISDLKIGPDGALYVVSLGSGAIYRLRGPDTPYALGGQLRYYAGDRPVPDATVRLVGAAARVDDSAANGTFAFTAVPGGPWQLRPDKQADVRNGLSTVDAVHILQTVAGTRPFSAAQALACDVTGDGTCSTVDATRILQRVAGLRTRFEAAETCRSDWVFVPAAAPVANQSSLAPGFGAGQCHMGLVDYAPLASDAAGQDFIAILLGDVTGNWDPSAAP